MPESRSWYLEPQLWLELFVLANLTFLGPDIYLAHSQNSFRHAAEYIPLTFSLSAPVILLVGLVAYLRWGNIRLWRVLGLVVGATAVAVGVAGLLWHLDSRFFRERTLDSLVYTAPFAAPLAYTGIGLLLIMNRMVPAGSVEWSYWVLLLALGGFVGNLIFSLADHAQNAFYERTEWIPVASSALTIGFMVVPFLLRIDRSFLHVLGAVLLAQIAVGILGFYYHTRTNLHGPSPSAFDNFVYGAPAMAPLLFPNLALLAGIGLWVLCPLTPPMAERS
jgi:hypothetical protein